MQIFCLSLIFISRQKTKRLGWMVIHLNQNPSSCVRGASSQQHYERKQKDRFERFSFEKRGLPLNWVYSSFKTNQTQLQESPLTFRRSHFFCLSGITCGRGNPTFHTNTHTTQQRVLQWADADPTHRLWADGYSSLSVGVERKTLSKCVRVCVRAEVAGTRQTGAAESLVVCVTPTLSPPHLFWNRVRLSSALFRQKILPLHQTHT